ncbi:MAG: nucleoside triphosphate pyrophosphohydrolase [Magnetococcales bacterium]|nr:nucleoside triphosphate pyrophosphohydrolase [Magnetococcales bacterium]
MDSSQQRSSPSRPKSSDSDTTPESGSVHAPASSWPTPSDDPVRDLQHLVARLRSPNGCPWDRKQTHSSLLPYTIEEVYEVVDAVETDSWEGLKEELGDLLFHVMLYSRIAEEQGLFSLDDVASDAHEKMVLRHPHVFGTGEDSVSQEIADGGAEAVVRNWDDLKKNEKARRKRKRLHIPAPDQDAAGSDASFGSDTSENSDDTGDDTAPSTPPSIFEGLSNKMPSLLWATKVQQKMARTGFDWRNPEEILEKVTEEASELVEARHQNDPKALEEEFGDLLFALVNVGRHLKLHPENALRTTLHKVINRFHYVEQQLHAAGHHPSPEQLEQMEMLWNHHKTLHKSETSP